MFGPVNARMDRVTPTTLAHDVLYAYRLCQKLCKMHMDCVHTITTDRDSWQPFCGLEMPLVNLSSEEPRQHCSEELFGLGSDRICHHMHALTV